MRLINVITYALEDFYDASIPRYAILSHTWETEEVLFKDMENLGVAMKTIAIGDKKEDRDTIEKIKRKRGFRKIEFMCRQTLKDYLEYAWVDTCCIDKTSSAELQEAINSMYSWYANAEYCYVFLADIIESCPVLFNTNAGMHIGAVSPSPTTPNSSIIAVLIMRGERLLPDEERYFRFEAFSNSKWFTRGWTLQELIAPSAVLFYGASWNFVGSKRHLTDTIAKITNIDSDLLKNLKPLSLFSVAQKMSWAAHRETSRFEDQAYSLLGLFGVSMPMLYGEGSKAFLRLQEEVMRTTADHTILAWDSNDKNARGLLLARSPADFARCQRVATWGRPEPFEMTSRGLRISLPLMSRFPERQLRNGSKSTQPGHSAILNCRYTDDPSCFLGLSVSPYSIGKEFYVDLARHDNGAEGRLNIVTIVDARRAQKTSIEITRAREQGKIRRLMWLHIAIDRDPTIVDFWTSHGRTTLRDQLVVVEIDDACHARATALLKCYSGAEFGVSFSFETFQQARGVSQFEDLVMDVSLRYYTHPRSGFADLCGRLEGDRDKCRSKWFDIVQNTSELEVGEAQMFTAEISLQNILGQDIIVCTVLAREIEPTPPVEIYTADDDDHWNYTLSDHDRWKMSPRAAPRLDTTSWMLGGR